MLVCSSNWPTEAFRGAEFGEQTISSPASSVWLPHFWSSWLCLGQITETTPKLGEGSESSTLKFASSTTPLCCCGCSSFWSAVSAAWQALSRSLLSRSRSFLSYMDCFSIDVNRGRMKTVWVCMKLADVELVDRCK